MFKRLLNRGKYLFAKESSSILSAATIIMFATLASALLGVIRTRLLIQYFYTNKEIVDVFWAAFRLPDMVFQIIVVGALSSAFIPVFSRYMHDDDEASTIASSMINAVMTVMICLSIAIFIFAPQLSRLIAGGFTPSQLSVMVDLTRIMSVAQIFFGFSSFLTGIIQSHKRFLIPALSPILYNFGIIVGIVFLSKKMGIYAPAVGVVLGAIFHLLSQLPLAMKLGFRYRLTWKGNHGAVREMSRMMLPRMLALSLIQIEQTAVITFSSWLSVGTVTMMTIASQLSNLPIRLIGIPIGQASLPFFSKETASNNLRGLAEMVNNSILQMVYLALPASAIVLVLRIPLVRLAYGADSFPWAETVSTGKLVAVLALSIVAGSLTHIVVRVFYALHDTKTPFLVNLISTTVNIGLSFYLLFVIRTGVLGMALAIALADTLETAILTVILYNRARFDLSEIGKPMLKMLFITVLTGFSLWLPLHYLDTMVFDTTRTGPLILLTLTVTVIGMGVYLGLSYLFKVKELTVFMALVNKIGNWRTSLRETPETIEPSESSV